MSDLRTNSEGLQHSAALGEDVLVLFFLTAPVVVAGAALYVLFS